MAFIEGDAFIEGAIEYQKSLATRLSLTSGLLCGFFPEEVSQFWHVVSPRFRKPGISLRGQSMSSPLMELAEQTRDLFVSFHAMAGQYDGDDYYPPCHVWEIRPPQGISIIGRAVSDCFSDRNLPGFSATIYCAQIEKDLSLEEFEHLLKEGSFNPDLPGFSRGGEVVYDLQKPEALLMDMIDKDQVVRLEFALWLLEAIRDAKEIHPEDIPFEIHKFWTERK